MRYKALSIERLVAAYRTEVRRGHPEAVYTMPDDDAWATMTDLAREGREQDFKDMARMLGVDPERIGPMWEGVCRRVGR
jgi:hypothetical protein